MMLPSLVRLYDNLQKKGEVPAYGWSRAKVTDRLVLDEGGNIIGFISARSTQKRGKKEIEVPAVLMVPLQSKRSVDIKANFLCDGPGYLLGIDNKGKARRTRECFEAAKHLHLAVLADAKTPAGKAVRNFFQSWQPDKARENQVVASHWEDILSAGNLIFEFEGQDVQDEPEVAGAWDRYYAGLEASEAKLGTCLVTGQENQAIELLHPSIKGVRGAQSSGASLVSFNAPSFESYGCDGSQGMNAPVSKSAAFRYGAALNYLTQDEKHVQTLADTTVVYWAEHAECAYQDIFADLMGENKEVLNDHDLEQIFRQIAQGEPVSLEGVEISPQEPFYVLGLAPNAARLSVRFFLCNSFGTMTENIMAHHQQMAVVGPRMDAMQPRIIPIWLLLKRTTNPKAKQSASSPLLAGEIYRSILWGRKYPLAAYQNMLLRIFSERDEYDEQGKQANRKIDYVRAGFIKACLLRNYKARWGDKINMSVNENCREMPYVLGRLFAVLERIQQNANLDLTLPTRDRYIKARAKATIKVRYFNSACAMPASVFPVLIKLANAHLRKIGQDPKKEGILQNSNKELGHLLDMIAMPEQGQPLPKRLTLEEQGAFVLGYYQQEQSYFAKEKGDNDDE